MKPAMKSDVSDCVLASSPTLKTYEATYSRVKCDYRDLSEKFKNKKKDFSKQYAHIYASRSSKMRAHLLNRVRAEWGNGVEVKKLADLQEESDSERCVIIGIIYKHQELHPSILKDISEELQVVPQQKTVRFVDDKDELILEDDVQRIRLCGDIDVHSFVTGVVVALQGRVSADRFYVEKICYSGPMSPSGLTLKPQDPERYLVIVSGLELAQASDSLLPLKMFSDWVTGWLGDPSDQHRNSRIALVLIAGNLIRGSSEGKDGKIINTHVETSSDVLAAVKMADDILGDLAETVHVELMPGEFDPSNLMLPQQPLHYKMFPSASSFSSLHGATNPHSFEVENCLVTGSSGQAVSDIGRYSNLEDPLEALESTFRWGHICPTCPDSLPCYPYCDDDPFVLDRQPNVFFSANHEKFQSKLISSVNGGCSYGKLTRVTTEYKTSFFRAVVSSRCCQIVVRETVPECERPQIETQYDGEKQDTRLVIVPSFNKTKSCVVIGLSSLKCEKVSFNVGELSR